MVVDGELDLSQTIAFPVASPASNFGGSMVCARITCQNLSKFPSLLPAPARHCQLINDDTHIRYL